MGHNFNKQEGKLYFGLPSGLQPRIMEIMGKIGLAISAGDREYEFPSYEDPDVIFRVFKTRDIPRAVAQGVVDFSVIGEDVVIETGNERKVEMMGGLPFSRQTAAPARLVLAVKKGVFKSALDLKGLTIATEFPRLTRRQLIKVLGFKPADLKGVTPSLGKTEGSVIFGQADAIADLTETGRTLRAMGLEELAILFESYPAMIVNPEVFEVKRTREKIEDIFYLMRSTLDAESNPSSIIRVNIPKEKLEGVLRLVPDRKTANILLTESEVMSVEFLADKRQKNGLVPRLWRAGAETVIAQPVSEIYRENGTSSAVAHSAPPKSRRAPSRRPRTRD